MINKNSKKLAVITMMLIGLLSAISYSIRSGNDVKKESFADDNIVKEQFDVVDTISTTDIEENTKDDISMISSGISFEVPAPTVTEEVIVKNDTQTIEAATTTESTEITYVPVTNSGVLTPSKGVNYGPSGKETYYNLDMSGCIETMRSYGNTDEYWVREDGCKMLGPYIMCAANLDLQPRGTLVESSLGTCIVVDTGGFASIDATQIDIATTW